MIERPAKPRSHRAPRVHIRIKDGQFQILGLGGWRSYWRDPYYLMLTVPWPGFIVIVIGLYAIANAVCALLFLLGGPETILNAQPGSFADAFFFSVQTSASIGYGAMSPGNTYGHVLVSLEAIASILGIALLTGLAYTRFSRATAQVVFSKVAVITPFDGTPTLTFRVANQRRNQIAEAQMRLYLARDEYRASGMMRRFYEMRLLRDRNPSFYLTWTVLHPIDEKSPLQALSEADVKRSNVAIIVSLSGIDQTVNQAIHARHTYSAADFRWNYHLKDILHTAERRDAEQSKEQIELRYIDFADFHEAEKDAANL